MKGKVNFMKRIIAVMAAGLLFAGLSLGAFASSERVVPSGIAFENVGGSIEKWAAENPDEYVSFAAAVFSEDDILYRGAFGYSDREKGVAADTDNTVYEWGSTTKTLVWVSVMQLWEKGMIDLEKDIKDYLPEGFLHNLKYDDPITMLNLMNHDAGWGENVWAYEVSDENKVISLGDALYATQPAQIYRPGEVCSYSNYGAALAGYVVECITGVPFYEYVHKNIFEPLGMEHTSIRPAHDDNAWVQSKRKELVCYVNTGNGWVSAGPQLVYILPYPAGAACGTIGDLAIYGQSFVRPDCPLFEREETRQLLFSATSALKGTDIGVSYHGLWAETYGDVQVIGHNGATNGCTAYMFFNVESGVGTAILMNGNGIPMLEIPKIVFGSEGAAIPAGYEKITDSTEDLSGVYIGARAVRHGPLKFMSYLGLMPATAVGNGEYDVAGMAKIETMSNGLLWFVQDGAGYPGVAYQLADGTRVFTLGSQSFVDEPFLIPNVVLIAIYIVCTLVGVILLLVNLILVLVKKYKKYTGDKFITAAKIARIVSVGVIVFWLSVFPLQYGITKAQGIVGCVIQMICAVIYLIAAAASCKGLFTKDEKRKVRYVMNILENVLCFAAVISLELIRFWGV